MKLKSTLIALAVAASLTSDVAFAERVGTGAEQPTPVASAADLGFTSEQQFLNVSLLADTTRTFANGDANSAATVSPGNSVAYEKGWQARMELSTIAAQPNFQGGRYNPVYDYVSHSTFNNTVSPPRAAHSYTPGFYVCRRASGYAEVTKSTGNPSFPNYCGNPISVTATTNDPECPAY